MDLIIIAEAIFDPVFILRPHTSPYMLPDLPELKAELSEIYLRYVSRRAHAQLGVFSEAPFHIIHEGARMRVERAEGDVEETRMMDASAGVVISTENVEPLTQDERMRILNDLADRMAREISGKLFASLSESLDRAGQTVDNHGRPLDAEVILRVLERMEFKFNEDGHPVMPTIQIDESMREAWERANYQLKNDPVWAQRLLQLIGEKKANWRDREATRKLVG